MKRFLLILTMMLLAVPGFGQTTFIRNFDAVITQDNANIVIQPPVGKTWTLLRGSFVLEEPLPGAAVTIFEQQGEAPGLCTNLIRAALDYRASGNIWIPIVGGFTSQGIHLTGQPEPIVLPYPFRLVIHVNNVKHPASVRSFTRFTIQEN